MIKSKFILTTIWALLFGLTFIIASQVKTKTAPNDSSIIVKNSVITPRESAKGPEVPSVKRRIKIQQTMPKRNSEVLLEQLNDICENNADAKTTRKIGDYPIREVGDYLSNCTDEELVDIVKLMREGNIAYNEWNILEFTFSILGERAPNETLELMRSFQGHKDEKSVWDVTLMSPINDILHQLSKEDPVAAVNELKKNKELVRINAYEKVFSEFAQQDFNLAIKYLHEIDDTERGKKYALKAILNKATDDENYKKLLNLSAQKKDSKIVSRALLSWARRSPVKAMDWADSNLTGQRLIIAKKNIQKTLGSKGL